MPRTARATPAGYVYHILNRGVGRQPLFRKQADYQAFADVFAHTLEKVPLRICGYCWMPNHWHWLVWPETNTQVSEFFRRLTVTHAARWQRHQHNVGTGHVYQGRFKSFPVQTNAHFYQVLRYVERNALRAGLVKDAAEWRWGSLWLRTHGPPDDAARLCKWPVPQPRNWAERVNLVETAAELTALHRSVVRGTPYGSAPWVKQTAHALNLESTIRARGRPRQAR